MSKINIVFVLPSLSAGGAQRVILNIIEKLDKNKFFVYLFVFNKGGPLVRHIPSNVKVISFNKNKLRSAYFPLILKLYKINPDIVLSTLPHVNFSIILFKLIFRSDCSVVVREANTASNTVRLSKYPRITKFLYKWLYGRSDKVIALSKSMMNDLVNNIGVDKNKIEVIYNPVYVDKIRSKVNIKRRNGSFKYSYLASGRLIKQKGFDRLIESFVSYPDSHLIVMGDGPELEKLDDIVSINNLQSRVTFIGHQDNPWEWYAGADVLLVSSHWEGMSNAVLEALACGCPVVATPEAGGIEDVKMLSSNDAVTIVQFGDKFVKSAMDIGKRYYSNESTSSLLPEEFDVDNAVCNYEKLFVYLYKKANP